MFVFWKKKTLKNPRDELKKKVYLLIQLVLFRAHKEAGLPSAKVNTHWPRSHTAAVIGADYAENQPLCSDFCQLSRLPNNSDFFFQHHPQATRSVQTSQHLLHKARKHTKTTTMAKLLFGKALGFFGPWDFYLLIVWWSDGLRLVDTASQKAPMSFSKPLSFENMSLADVGCQMVSVCLVGILQRPRVGGSLFMSVRFSWIQQGFLLFRDIATGVFLQLSLPTPLPCPLNKYI